MTCLECGGPIVGRRLDSKYCSKTCSNRAKQKRAEQRLIEKATGIKPETPAYNITPDYTLHGFTEIRELEKDKYTTISDLKEKYEKEIKTLETCGLNKDFEITRLKDKIIDLERTHERELRAASSNTTKETVKAITAMPAIQSALGALAGNLIPNANSSLGSIENTYNTTETQIIESIRKMQPDAQQYLIQMLYFLFAKDHEQQMEIFTTLSTFMQNESAEEPDK